MYAQEISASRFVELRLGVVVSETPSYFTHTHIILSQHVATFLFTQPSIHTRHSHEPRTTCLLSFVPVYQHVLSFPVCFSQWGIKNFYIVFPYSLKERVKKGYLNSYLFFFFLWRCDPTRVMASSFLKFLDHTQRCTTVGRTPLDE